jgi:hypothetical protein
MPAPVPARSSRVRLDLNSPEFQEVLFELEPPELLQVIRSLRRLRGQDWNGVYSRSGLHWEAIGHIQAPNGARVCSLRLSQKIRAICYRYGDYLRLVSLHPDHDSAYRG